MDGADDLLLELLQEPVQEGSVYQPGPDPIDNWKQLPVQEGSVYQPGPDPIDSWKQSPVQEGSVYQPGPDPIDSWKQPPLVSMDKDYFMSSAGSQLQQPDEDLLNLVVQSADLLRPDQLGDLKRSNSIQQLMEELQASDGPSTVPMDLCDVELHEVDPPFDTQMLGSEFDAAYECKSDAEYSKVDNQLQQAMAFESQPGSGGSTSSTNMALTYEFPSLQVTQKPQQPHCAEEEQHQQLAPRLRSLKLERQEPVKSQPQPQLPLMKDEQQQQQLQQQQQQSGLPKLPVFGDQTQAAAGEMVDSCHTASQLLPESQPELESPVSEAPSSPQLAEEDPNAMFTAQAARHIRDLLGLVRQQVQQNAKPQAHEFVLVALLHKEVCNCELQLDLLMDFCDCNGHPGSTDREHFSAKDTKSIGFLWQKLKGNRNANYDTFARAMRVGRERSKGYFDYLESGKGSKKRVYRLANKGLKELLRTQRELEKALQPYR